MLATVIKHYIYDAGLSMLMDNVINNFQIYIPSQYLGNYWEAYDEDGELIVWGLCIQHEGELIVIDDGDGEYVVHTDLYKLVHSSKIDCDKLNAISDVDDEKTLIEYLKNVD